MICTYNLWSGIRWTSNAGKSRTNIEKHGVSFRTASRIFESPVLTVEDVRFDYGEVRENSIGVVDGVLFLVVTLRIPTKPATHSNRKPATYSNMKPARIPI